MFDKNYWELSNETQYILYREAEVLAAEEDAFESDLREAYEQDQTGW